MPALWNAPLPIRLLLSALLLAFSAAQIPLCEELAERWTAGHPTSGDYTRLPFDLILLCLSALCCLMLARRAWLGWGSAERWRAHGLKTAAVFAIPPLLVVTVYAQLDNPFRGSPWSMWLLSSIAQELFFAGFVYAAFSALWGEPGAERTRDLFHPVLLLTALCFAAWHWPNIRYFTRGFMALQFTYTFLGMLLTLQMRRWTGSLWPGAVNHVVVNALASVV